MSSGMSAVISCPQCGSPFDFREGSRNGLCPSCKTSLAVCGEAGVARFFLEERLDLARARVEARKSLAAAGVDPKVAEMLRFEGGELCFLPFWSLRALVTGWRWLEKEVVVREEVVDENGCKSYVERRGPNEQHFETVASPIDFSSPAFDPSACGLRGIALAGAVLSLKLMNHEALSQRATVFDPVKGAALARQEALAASKKSRPAGTLRCMDRFVLCGERLALISYPVWRLTFSAGERIYPVVVDGINGRMLKGRFPGPVVVRLWQPMAVILLLLSAYFVHPAAGSGAVTLFLGWFFSVHGTSLAELASFFALLVERKEDIEHG